MIAHLLLVLLITFSAVDANSIKQKTESTDISNSLELNETCLDGGQCVPYHKCLEYDGAGVFNIRTNENDFLPCESLQVCCDKDNINHDVPEFITQKHCGFRNEDGLGNYAYGKKNESQFGEFPWSIAVLKKMDIKDNAVTMFLGGGSLIHPSIVLTSAIKVFSLLQKSLLVRGGEWNSQSIHEILPHKDHDVKEIMTHEKFNRANFHNNIALLFLKKPFKLEPHINTICLPQPDYDNEGQECFATGWGKNEFGRNGNYQTFLKKIELPIIGNKKCQELLRETRLGEDFILDPGFMCAGGEEGKDLCTGDGGGSLTCSIPGSSNNYYQAGIVAGGIGCGTKDVPGLFMDIKQYLKWIQAKANSKNFEL